jgi:hypothetical protein
MIRYPLRSHRHAVVATLASFSLVVLGAAFAAEDNRTRRELPFPDLPGYVTLRCDFHMHTVFSDGLVWPTLRVEEAWRDGLDVIAITDHNESQRFKDDVPPKFGRSHELALPAARSLGLLLIRACEITRGEPPGHLNALFVKDVSTVRRDDSREAVKSAFEQGAFLFWNHPGWKQPGRKSVWYAEQDEFFRNGWLKGVEIVNGNTYDPIAHGWAREKPLTMLGNTDIHDLTAWQADRTAGERRTMTLVFAKEKTEAAIKEALLARRTIVFAGGQLFGEEELLRPFVQQCLEVLPWPALLKGTGRGVIQIRNRSATPLKLEFPTAVDGIKASAAEVPAGAINAVSVTGTAKTSPGARAVALPCDVTNALTAPDRPLRLELKVPVRVEK